MVGGREIQTGPLYNLLKPEDCQLVLPQKRLNRETRLINIKKQIKTSYFRQLIYSFFNLFPCLFYNFQLKYIACFACIILASLFSIYHNLLREQFKYIEQFI